MRGLLLIQRAPACKAAWTAASVPTPSTMRTKSPSGVLETLKIFATVSVDIQRGRPSLPIRFDLLSAVGSSPAMIDRRDADHPCSCARASTAFQICSLVNMRPSIALTTLRCHTHVHAVPHVMHNQEEDVPRNF